MCIGCCQRNHQANDGPSSLGLIMASCRRLQHHKHSCHPSLFATLQACCPVGKSQTPSISFGFSVSISNPLNRLLARPGALFSVIRQPGHSSWPFLPSLRQCLPRPSNWQRLLPATTLSLCYMDGWMNLKKHGLLRCCEVGRSRFRLTGGHWPLC